MLGWKLFTRALSLLIENLGVALRLSAVPYGLVVAATILAWNAGPDAVVGMGVDPVTGQQMSVSLADLAVAFVNLFASLWIAVAWHRFVLLAEAPRGWVAPFHGGLLLGYLGGSLLVGLLVLLVMLVASTVVAVALLPLFGQGASVAVGATALFVAMILFYRLALILPAGAIGRSMGLGEAMRATVGHSGTVVVLALVTVAFSLLLQVPTLLDGGAGGAVTLVYQLVIGWVGLLLGVGTLTALYGHLIEGRPA